MEQVIEFIAPFIPAAAFLAFLLGDAFSDAYQFRDIIRKDDEIESMVSTYTFKLIMEAGLNYNRLWHRWQAVRQAAVIALAAWAYHSLPALVLFASSFWLVHDGIVNTVGLNRPWFFVGTTAWIDRLFQKTRHPELFMGIAKGVFIAFSIIVLLFS